MHYEQEMTLLRSEAEGDMRAYFDIKSPEMYGWAKIKEGPSIVLPSGKTQIPFAVIIDVPKDAALGDYHGRIDISSGADDNKRSGGVSLVLGAQIDIKIGVVREIYREFDVKMFRVDDMRLARSPWNRPVFSGLFQRLKIGLKIKNTGNAEIAPSKVEVDIFDIGKENLLLSLSDENVKKIPAFQTQTVYADFPFILPAGQYWARIRVYNNSDVVGAESAAFTVNAPSAFEKSDLTPWLAAGVVFFSFGLILFFVFKRDIKIFQKDYLRKANLQSVKRIMPIRLIGRRMLDRFWQKVRQKSDQKQKEKID